MPRRTHRSSQRQCLRSLALALARQLVHLAQLPLVQALALVFGVDEAVGCVVRSDPASSVTEPAALASVSHEELVSGSCEVSSRSSNRSASARCNTLWADRNSFRQFRQRCRRKIAPLISRGLPCRSKLALSQLGHFIYTLPRQKPKRIRTTIFRVGLADAFLISLARTSRRVGGGGAGRVGLFGDTGLPHQPHG